MGNVGGCLWNRIFKLSEEQELIFNRSAQALYPVNLTVPLPSDRRNFPGDADQTAFAEVRIM